jgi:hypothetical protein
VHPPKPINKNRIILERNMQLWEFNGKTFKDMKDIIPDGAIIIQVDDDSFFRFFSEETDEEYARRLKNHEIAKKRYNTWASRQANQ